MPKLSPRSRLAAIAMTAAALVGAGASGVSSGNSQNDPARGPDVTATPDGTSLASATTRAPQSAPARPLASPNARALRRAMRAAIVPPMYASLPRQRVVWRIVKTSRGGMAVPYTRA